MPKFKIRDKILPSNSLPYYPSGVRLPTILLPSAVSLLGITQWPVAWQMTHAAPARLPLLSSSQNHLFLIMLASFRSLNKLTGTKCTHSHSSQRPRHKSKQELSGRLETCLMQQDERCCRVVENWSLWSCQVGLNNNKLAETTSMSRQKDTREKRGKRNAG